MTSLWVRSIGKQKCKNFISGQLLTDEPDLVARSKLQSWQHFQQWERERKPWKQVKDNLFGQKNDIQFVSRLLAVAKAREIDRKDVHTCSLRKCPSPIATTDENRGKTSKAKLMHEIDQKRVENLDVEFIPKKTTQWTLRR